LVNIVVGVLVGIGDASVPWFAPAAIARHADRHLISWHHWRAIRPFAHLSGICGNFNHP
jgi:hypothetical protein